MASIKERVGKDGKIRYQSQVRLKGFPAQTATFFRKTDAKKWAQDTETKIREGRHFKVREAKKRTLSELIDKYMASVLPFKRSQKSQKGQLLWWKEKLGYLYLADVTSSIIADKRDELLRGITPRNKKRTPATVVRYLAVLSHMFSYAVMELEWLEDNPVSRIRKPSEPRGRVRFLSSDERKRLLKACQESKNKHLYLIVLLALSTGMRAGEILNLTWPSIYLESGVIILHHTKNNERRRIPLTGLVLDLLKKKKEEKSLSLLLFPGKKKNSPIDIRSAWENALKKAKIKDYCFHSNRHDFASNLLSKGATIAQIAEVLGHKTLQCVKRYSHLCEGTARDIVGKMTEELFG